MIDNSNRFLINLHEAASADETDPVISTSGLNAFYGTTQALTDVSLDIYPNEVTAIIGPSGCGKSTLLKCFNRMNDIVDGYRQEGRVIFDGEDIGGPEADVVHLRARAGMVFQKANPFPKSIYDNVAFGPRIHKIFNSQAELDHIVENALKRAALWDEVEGDLGQAGTKLSGGQQQRLCIAMALANQPEVLLMDEPCSALDPIATAKIEHLIDELRERYAIVIVTHSMQQAARVSQRTAFMGHGGELVEHDETQRMFNNPRDSRTEGYITGRFG